jgi:5-methylcytosine-specific restriction protein A
MRLVVRFLTFMLLALGVSWLIRHRETLGTHVTRDRKSGGTAEPDLEARLAALESNTAPSSKDFEAALDGLMQAARQGGETFVEVSSGDLHRLVGGYPGPNHRMPTCCTVMRGRLNKGDIVLREPKRSAGANLALKYFLTPSR